MAGFNNGLIRLDNSPIGVFYSGQVILGSVLFNLDKPLTFSVLNIQFLGEAKVLWTENEVETVNGVEKNKIVKYLGREEYFNYTQTLAGGTGRTKLPTGGQSFAFKYQIPFTAPSSFNGEIGNVSYSMTVRLVHIDPLVPIEELTKPFEVVAPFDLNLGSPRIRQPIDLEFEEVYGCDCFCSPGPVTIRIRLPISGYCPGQIIPAVVEVENGSSVEITKMIFEIVSKELYRSQQPPSEYILPEKVLVTTKKGAIMPKSKRNFICDLNVPEFIAPYLENCGIIDVGYFVRVTIKLSGCNDELQDEAEICLGLVPVREFIEVEYVHPLAHSLPMGPIPVDDGPPELLVPPVAAGLAGSNTSLHRVQYNPVSTAGYPNSPPSYQSVTQPHGSENRFDTAVAMEQKPRPYNDYTIGFKLSDGPAGGMPYPNNMPSGGSPPPYPGVAQPPYPTGNMMPQVNSGLPPYGQGGYVPSAPPLND